MISRMSDGNKAAGPDLLPRVVSILWVSDNVYE